MMPHTHCGALGKRVLETLLLRPVPADALAIYVCGYWRLMLLLLLLVGHD